MKGSHALSNEKDDWVKIRGFERALASFVNSFSSIIQNDLIINHRRQ